MLYSLIKKKIERKEIKHSDLSKYEVERFDAMDKNKNVINNL